jgi:mannosyltransferase OCH1-like enzyme
MDNITIIDTKYNNWEHDRTNSHYSKLFQNGFVYKKKITDIDVDIFKPCIYQIWIQSQFVSINMYNAIQTNINNNKYFNYKLLTNDKIIKLIENDYEFPLLLKVYNKLIPYAYKSDLIRYYILYKYGGVYIDSDFVSINGIQELYENNDFVVCKDLNANNIFNGFICSKKGNLFFKFLVEQIIHNILVNKINYNSDLEITGPAFVGNHFEQYFQISKPFNNGFYSDKNTRFTILNYSINLPLPKGSWINSSRNIHIQYNTLYAECKTISGEWNKTNIDFYVEDEISNMNGILISSCNLNRKTNFDKNSTFVYDDNKLYFNSKYDNYDYEKVKLLNGNNYAVMYKSNNIINHDD